MTDVTGLALIVAQALRTTPVLGVAEGRVWLVGAFPVFGAALAGTLEGGWRTVEPAVNAWVTGQARLLTTATARLRGAGAGLPVEAADPVPAATFAIFASAGVEVIGAGGSSDGIGLASAGCAARVVCTGGRGASRVNL